MYLAGGISRVKACSNDLPLLVNYVKQPTYQKPLFLAFAGWLVQQQLACKT